MLNKETEKLKSLIENAKTILVTAHTSPDPDAVASTLLIKKILETTYKDKKILANIEDNHLYFDFLPETKEITNTKTIELLKSTQIDLILITDCSGVKRIVNNNDLTESIKFIESQKIKIAVVDHHQKSLEVGDELTIETVNELRSSAAEQVFKTFLEDLNLQKPKNYANIAMLGIITDSGQFMRFGHNYKEGFRIVTKLCEDGANIEFISHELVKYTKFEIDILKEYFSNLVVENGYTYSYLTDPYYESIKDIVPAGLLSKISHEVVDKYIKNIEKNAWGFVTKPSSDGPNLYSISFRAKNQVINLIPIANKFGGGGHKAAAGAQFKADNINDAIKQIKQAIANNLQEAIDTR